MESNTVIIPANYTDAGKILGIFEIRKLVEAMVLCVPLLGFLLFSLPFSITTNIVISAVIVVPVGGFALTGIHDYSLLDFVRVYLKWRKQRKILTFDGEIPVEKEVKKSLTFAEICDRMKFRRRGKYGRRTK